MFLEKPSKKSHGGVCQIHLYDISNGVIEPYPDIINLVYNSAVGFTPPNDWEEIVFEQWTARPREARVEQSGSVGYGFSLSGIIHIDSGERRSILFDAERKDYLLKYTDQNGITKLVGTVDEPVSITTNTRDGGAQYGDGTKMEVSIQCTNTAPFAEYPF